MASRRVKKNSLLNRSMSCDPNLDDPAVQAKIGGRLTKTINKTIGMYGEMLTAVVFPGHLG